MLMDEWTGFFSALAGVAVTAFSVLFVSLQVRSDRWTGSPLKWWAAVAALAELFIPMAVSLITLMPGHPRSWAAWLSGAFGLAVIFGHVRAFALRQASADRFDRQQAIFGGVVSGVVYSAVFVSGFLSSAGGVYLLASLLIWLLFSGATEAWLLLEPRGVDASEPPAALDV